jgi:DNA-binding response OmpR family regulator
LRRDAHERVMRHGALELDVAARTRSSTGQDVDLTTLEFDLLRAFAAAPGRVFRREELIERVWGGAYDGNDRVVDVHVSNLRQKLADAPAATSSARSAASGTRSDEPRRRT